MNIQNVCKLLGIRLLENNSPSYFGANGLAYADPGLIVLQEGMENGDRECVFAHEVGHILAHRAGHGDVDTMAGEYLAAFYGCGLIERYLVPTYVKNNLGNILTYKTFFDLKAIRDNEEVEAFVLTEEDLFDFISKYFAHYEIHIDGVPFLNLTHLYEY